VPQGGDDIFISFGPGDFDNSKVEKGASVFKSDDPSVRKEIEQTLKIDRVVKPVAMNVNINTAVGGALEIECSDEDGNRACVTWPGPLERANKYPLTETVVKEQFSRLGGTLYALGHVKMESAEPVMVPKSVLNELRRQAVEKLILCRREKTRHVIAEADALEKNRGEIKSWGIKREGTGLSVSKRVSRAICRT
jgi:putative protease